MPININELTAVDIGKRVVFKPERGRSMRGRIKSWDSVHIHVVLGALNSDRKDWQLCPADAINPDSLEWYDAARR